MICPCCSQSTGNVDPLWLGPYIRLTGHEGVLYDLLARQFGKVVDSARVIDAMYSQDPNGGADTANKILHVTAARVRRKVETYGLLLQGVQGGRHGGGYVLRWAPRVLSQDEIEKAA